MRSKSDKCKRKLDNEKVGGVHNPRHVIQRALPTTDRLLGEGGAVGPCKNIIGFSRNLWATFKGGGPRLNRRGGGLRKSRRVYLGRIGAMLHDDSQRVRQHFRAGSHAFVIPAASRQLKSSTNTLCVIVLLLISAHRGDLVLLC